MQTRTNKLGALALIALALLLSCQTSQRQEPIKHQTADLRYEPPRVSKSAIPGRYIGYLRLKDGMTKLPYVLDLVEVKSKGQQSTMHAVTKLSLGSYTSDEFYGEFHQNIIFDDKTNTFYVPVEAEKHRYSNVTLKGDLMVSGQIDDANGNALGDFMAVYSGKRQKVDLEKMLAQIFPKQKVLNPISGSYTSQCDQKSKKLVLETVRWPNQTSDSTNLLSDYRANGYASSQDKLCANGEGLCTETIFKNLRFNLASMELKLEGSPSSKNCIVTANGLSCKGCEYRADTSKPQAKLAAELRTLTRPPLRSDQLNMAKSKTVGKRPDFVGVVEGEYLGYLFNEVLQSNQLVRLKVNANYEKSEGMKKPGLVISGISTLFFGGPNSNEFVVYRYKPGFFSESGPTYVFNGDGEAFFQVTRWNEGSIRGIWYSKTYGRVGTVELVRGGLPEFKSNDETLSKISGTYHSSNLRLNLLAQSNLSEKERDFFPLAVKGVVSSRADAQKKHMVMGASFDIYTGGFSLLMDDGSFRKGSLLKNDLQLAWSETSRFGESAAASKTEKFIYEKDPFAGATAVQMFDLIKSSTKETVR